MVPFIVNNYLELAMLHSLMVKIHTISFLLDTLELFYWCFMNHDTVNAYTYFKYETNF
jgi:hypothetical protein